MVEKMVLAHEARLELEKESEKEMREAERKKQEEIAYNSSEAIREREEQTQWEALVDSNKGKVFIFLSMIISGAFVVYLVEANFVRAWYWLLVIFSLGTYFVGIIIFSIAFSPEDKEKGGLTKSDRELALIKEREFIKSEVAKSKARDAEALGNKENK